MSKLTKISSSRLPDNAEIIREEEQLFKNAMKTYWEPHLAEMMAKDLELALSNNDGDKKIAAEARERIYNRVYGRPSEVTKQDSGMNIIINLVSLDKNNSNNSSTIIELKGEGAIEGELIDNIYFLSEKYVTLDNEDGIKNLKKFIEKRKIDIVCIS